MPITTGSFPKSLIGGNKMAGKRAKAEDAIIKGASAANDAANAAGAAAKAAPKKSDTFIGRHLSGPAIANKIKQGSLTAPYEGYDKIASPSAYKKGGVVKKTGLALVHKGEKFTPAKGASKGGCKKR